MLRNQCGALRQNFTRNYKVLCKNSGSNNEVSSLLVKVHGGSRYADKAGVSHLLNRFNFQDTSKKSSLRLVRESELIGGQFQSQVCRENIVLSANFLKSDLPYYINAIGDTLNNTEFKKHEFVETVLPAAHHDYQVALLNPINKLEDALFYATFRNQGLGQPILYDGVEKIELDDIKKFSEKVYTQDNIEIFGNNIDETDLKNFLNDSSFTELPKGESLINKNGKPKFFNDEVRIRSNIVNDNYVGISIGVNAEEFNKFELLKTYLSTPLSGASIYSKIINCKLDKFADNIGVFTIITKGNDNIKDIVKFLRNNEHDLSKSIELTKTRISVNNGINEFQLKGLPNNTFVEPKNSDLKFKLNDFAYVALGNITQLPYKDEL